MPKNAAKPRRAGAWLNLSAASRLLGVNPATLRYWTDQGKVHAFRTPGGHRRYLEEELQPLLRSETVTAEKLRGLIQKVEENYRSQRLDLFASRSWYKALDAETLARVRQRGRALLELTFRLVSRPGSEEKLLAEGREMAEAWGREARRKGLTREEAVEAFLECRRPIQEPLGEVGKAGCLVDQRTLMALHRANRFLDQLLLSTLEGYDEEEEAPR